MQGKADERILTDTVDDEMRFGSFFDQLPLTYLVACFEREMFPAILPAASCL